MIPHATRCARGEGLAQTCRQRQTKDPHSGTLHTLWTECRRSSDLEYCGVITAATCAYRDASNLAELGELPLPEQREPPGVPYSDSEVPW